MRNLYGIEINSVAGGTLCWCAYTCKNVWEDKTSPVAYIRFEASNLLQCLTECCDKVEGSFRIEFDSIEKYCTEIKEKTPSVVELLKK